MQESAPSPGLPWRRLLRQASLACALGGGACSLGWIAWLLWTLMRAPDADGLGLVGGLLVLVGLVAVSAAGILGLAVMDGGE